MDGIGAYTSAWGTVSRKRAVCGTDTSRTAPCGTHTAEVVVTRGVVTAVRTAPGDGAIPTGSVVLVGREKGADVLRALKPGTTVPVDYHLTASTPAPFRFVVGGFPILRAGKPLSGLENGEPAPCTSAGFSADGHKLYLVVVDGRNEQSGGMTVSELAGLLKSMGAADAVNLDGGGSSTFTVRQPGQSTVTVANHPSDGSERAVANGIGIFSRQ